MEPARRPMQIRALSSLLFATALATALASAVAVAQTPAVQTPAPSQTIPTQASDRPWMNPQLPPADRADLVLKQLTLDEKIALLHGNGMAHAANWQTSLTNLANGGAGYVQGVNRLG